MYSQMKRGFLKQGLDTESKPPAPSKTKVAVQVRTPEARTKTSTARRDEDSGMYSEMKRGFLKAKRSPATDIASPLAPARAVPPPAAQPLSPGRFHMVCPEEDKAGQPNDVYRMPGPCYCAYSVDGAEAALVMIGRRGELERILPFGEAALQQPLPLGGGARPFRVAPTAQKGLGLFATRRIKAGELILAERPTVISSKTAHGTKFHVPYALAFYDAALAALSTDARAEFMALADSCSLGARTHPLPGRIMTNGYSCGSLTDAPDAPDASEGDAAAFAATFPTVSRANHACVPNAHYSWNKARWCGQVYAARDVPAGAEITTKYTTAATQAARQAFFERQYSCRCVCATCADAAPEDVRRSDARRAAVVRLLHTLENALDRKTFPVLSVPSVREMLACARQEGMMYHYARILWEVSRIMHVQENAVVGFEWAKEAREAHVLILGEDSWLIALIDDTGEYLAEKLREHGVPCKWP